MACRQVVRLGVTATLALALIVIAKPPGARGDGDPASDYLISNQVFLTSQSASVSPAERQLVALVRDANRRGFAIRVALIASDYDLGSITALWAKPGIYARFLGLELAPSYHQRLLVVMPNGFGFNWPGHSSAAEDRVLAGTPVADPQALAGAAQAAVRRLARAAGVGLGAVGAATPSPFSSGEIAVTAGLTVVLLAVLTGSVVALGRRRQNVVVVRRRSPRRKRVIRVPLRWAVPAIALLGALAIAAPILALRRNGGARVSPAAIVTPPPFSWAADRRPAPAFVLRDQGGRPVSISAYRGREVIVTFIDPLCRNLCPLEAQALNQMERQLPASRRPPILAVSVDVYANARADLLQDVREWHLVPEWRWAVGGPARLSTVWGAYNVGVRVTTKRIAGTTINYITHTEAAYVIDRNGYERALFLWPFYPQDMIRELQRVA